MIVAPCSPLMAAQQQWSLPSTSTAMPLTLLSTVPSLTKGHPHAVLAPAASAMSLHLTIGASGRSLGVVRSDDGSTSSPTWLWNTSISAIQFNESSRSPIRCLTSNTNGVFSNVAVSGCPATDWQAPGSVHDFDAAASAILNTTDHTVRFVFRDAYNLNKRNFSVCLTATWGEPCANTEFAGLPFCNLSLSADARADDLLARATTDELSNMLSNDGIKHAWLPRLGVATNNTQQEALHGTCASGGGPAPSHTPGTLEPGTGFGTSFPHATTLAATLNRTLWGMVGRAIGVESRAMSNQGVGGLFLRTPNLNLARDPRWGTCPDHMRHDAWTCVHCPLPHL